MRGHSFEWLFVLYKKRTVTLKVYPCNHGSMARLGNDKAILRHTEVRFSIETRTATSRQLEAGRRLFSRLLVKAQSSTQNANESNPDETRR